MPMIRASFPKQLEEGLNALFGLEYLSYPEEYPQVFDELDSNKAYEEDVLVAGFGPAPIVGEGEPFPEDEGREGWTARYHHVKIGARFALTQEAIEDNLYMRLGQRYSRELARSIKETVEVMAAGILNLSSDPVQQGGDQKPLVALDHPLLYGSASASNTLPTPSDLSESSLEDMLTQIRTAKNDRGLPIMLKPQKLIIPPQMMFEAERLMRSVGRPGTADNDINAIRSLGLLSAEPAVITRLSDPSRWYIKTDAAEGLKCYNRVKNESPKMFEDPLTGNLIFRARRRLSFGWSDWRGLYGTL